MAASVIIGALIAVLFLFSFRALIRSFRDGGCAGCSGCSSCGGSCSGNCAEAKREMKKLEKLRKKKALKR